MKSVPADLIVFDELDEATREAKAMIRERIAHSDYKRIIELSNPSLPQYGIDEPFQVSDQRHWTLQCPSCSLWTALEGVPEEVGAGRADHRASPSLSGGAAREQLYSLTAALLVTIGAALRDPTKATKSNTLYAPCGSHLRTPQKGARTMSARSTPKPVTTFASTVIVLILATALVAATAHARIAYNTIDPIATVTDNGRQVIVTGPIHCDGSQQADLRVTVTQRSTGAVAEGRALITCTGNILQWEVRALTQGRETFAEGPAIAVASARTSDRGRTDDAHQWLVNITLVGK